MTMEKVNQYVAVMARISCTGLTQTLSKQIDLRSIKQDKENQTRICASLGSRMKFKTLCYPVFGRHKNTALPSF